jgi:30S ribosomal protein S31
MGKGDKKSKKGKRFMGSYGNARKKSAIKARMKRNISAKPVVAVTVAVEEKPKAKRTTKKKEAA